jgi:hypothetical protein
MNLVRVFRPERLARALFGDSFGFKSEISSAPEDS